MEARLLKNGSVSQLRLQRLGAKRFQLCPCIASNTAVLHAG